MTYRGGEPVTRDDLEMLEFRLAEKVKEIEEVREQNSRKAIDAAWGLVPAVNSLVIWVGLYLLLQQTDWHWAGDGLAIAAALIFSGWIHVHSNKKRVAEVERLWKISRWDHYDWS